MQRKYELTKTEAIKKWAVKYAKVMTWLSKLQRKDESAWYLWLYCKSVNKNPDELLALKDNRASTEAESLLDNFIADQTLNIPHVTKVGIMIAVKSFFGHNYRELARKSGQITFEKKKPYRKHSKEELLKIYRATMNPRDRALVSFVWSTAIARESLTLIQWSDLEQGWESKEIPCITLESKKIKGHGVGKYKGVQQVSFLTPEAKKDLVDYREYMERIGVKWKPEDHIWLRVNAPHTPLGYDALSLIATDLTQRSGVPFSWHDGRRFVETCLEEIKINPNWARKIRGRKVKGEESPYSRPAIEQLRAAFKEAIPLLEFQRETELAYVKQKQEASDRIMAKILGGEPLDAEDKQAMTRYGLKIGRRREVPATEHNGGSAMPATFIEVKESDLLRALQEGWRIEVKLSSGSYILRAHG